MKCGMETTPAPPWTADHVRSQGLAAISRRGVGSSGTRSKPFITIREGEGRSTYFRDMQVRAVLSALVIAMLIACDARAQQGNDMQRMENELCGCMTMVDVKAKDAPFESEVRHCLEEAVVNHPSAMNALLREARGTESKGYQLGELLGKRLEPRCPAMRAISERLRRIHRDDPLLKSAS